MDDLKIRKLTPKECFRLMGFEDSDFEKAEKVNSNTQLYKQAGNSIVVPVVEYIIKALFDCGALENQEKEKEMELKVNTPTFPEVIEFNFLELKQEITERASAYMNLVYTENQIQEAKKDRAALNKFVKALSDERIKVKKECMKPYEDFEAKIKELDAIVNKAIKNIDDQLKSYEEQKKSEKLEQIQDYWNRITSPDHPLTLQRVMDTRWLNAITSMKSIQESINAILAKYAEDIATLQNLPEFSFEAVEVYKQTLDMHKAISEAKRMAEIQKKKAEAEFAKCMNPPEPPEEQLPGQIGFSDAESFDEIVKEATAEQKQWISFKALLTVEQALALKNFFDSRNIEFQPI